MVAVLPALSAGLSFAQGLSSFSSGRKDAKASRRLMKAQTRLLNQQAEQGAEMYNRYKSDFLPMENEYLDMVRAGVQPDYVYEAARSRREVGRNYDNEAARMQRELARLGINPSSPRYQSLMRETSLRRAADTAGAVNMGRRAASERAQNTGFARLGSAVDLGRQSLSTALGTTSSAASALGGVADSYGRRSASAFGDMADAFATGGYLANRALRGGRDGSEIFRPSSYTLPSATSLPAYDQPTGFMSDGAGSRYA